MAEKDETKQGRPTVFGKTERFHIREISEDLVIKIDKKVKENKTTRRAYLEHLLRTHPELQEDVAK